MLSVHWRMAELWTVKQKRNLTDEEEAELNICLQYNALFARKVAGLHNLSIAASLTSDADWQHEVCRQLEKLEKQFQDGFLYSRFNP